MDDDAAVRVWGVSGSSDGLTVRCPSGELPVETKVRINDAAIPKALTPGRYGGQESEVSDMGLTVAGFPEGTKIADLTDEQLEAWAETVTNLANSSRQSNLPDEPLVVLSVIEDGQSATVTLEQGSLWLHLPDSSRSGPFGDLSSVAAAHPETFELKEGMQELHVTSDHWSDIELADLLTVAPTFLPLDTNTPDWPRTYGTDPGVTGTLDSGLSINGAPWVYARDVRTGQVFLLPPDASTRDEFETIGRIDWNTESWSDETWESIERWRGACFFCGAYWEDGVRDRMFRDLRPASVLIWELLDWSEAWEWPLRELSIQTEAATDDEILARLPSLFARDGGTAPALVSINWTQYEVPSE